jgi:hypothetical protein
MKKNLLQQTSEYSVIIDCLINYSKKTLPHFRILIISFFLLILSNQVSFSQSSTCSTPPPVANGADSAWSEECYLNDNCGLQGNPCTANDVNMTRAFIADSTGQPIQAFDCSNPPPLYLWGIFNNGTGTNRYAVRTRSEVWIMGNLSTVINDCSFDTCLGIDTADHLDI